MQSFCARVGVPQLVDKPGLVPGIHAFIHYRL
jgi:hypothetical protein